MSSPGIKSGLRVLLMSSLMAVAFPTIAAELKVKDRAISVIGVTPSGRVVVFGVALEPLGYESRIHKIAESLTADPSGIVTYTSPAPTTRSAWAAVDLTSGVLLTGAPPESPAKFTDLLSEKLPLSVGTSTLARPGRMLFVLLARSQVHAAWTLAAGDGGPDDADGKGDAKVTLSFAHLQKLEGPGSSPAQSGLGDVIVAIDCHTLHTYTAQFLRH